MKKSAISTLVFSGLTFVVSVGNAMTMAELQAENTSVFFACKSEAANLSGYSLDSFMDKCRTEKTSQEAKVKMCELEMPNNMSSRSLRDPEKRAKYVDQCLPRLYPK